MKNNEKKLLSWQEAFKLNNRAFSLIYKYYPKMIISRLLYVIWEAITPYVGIFLSALIIEELAGSKNIDRLKDLIFISLISAALIALVFALIAKFRDTVSAGKYYKVEQILTKKLLQMDFVSVDDTKTHELLSTIRQNANSGGWGLARIIDNYESFISSLFTVIGGISLTVTLFCCRVPESAGKYVILNNPIFIVIVIAVMLAVTYIAPTLATKATRYWAMNSDLHNMSNRLFGFFGWLGYKMEFATDVRIYRQDLLCEKYNNDKTGAFGSKGMFAKYSIGPMGLYNAASAAVSVVFIGVVYAFVCIKAWAGAFGVGAVTQYIASITKVSTGVSAMIENLGDMRSNAEFLKVTFKFLDIPNSMYQGSLTVEKRSDYNYEIEFKNVSFKYPGSDNYSLKNVNMKFRIGERLAVVGQNGSGKTTFIKLLCRLYDPTEGEILLNGINIKKYNYEDYMSIFSVVFQDFKLLSFQLGQNVAAKLDYDKTLVLDCLNKSGFGEKYSKLENGTETYLYKDITRDGVDVSGGEAQKIALARALYKDAPFIILDEPTAALDPISEAEIYSKFNEIVGKKTAVYISHRLSSCIFCSNILVFDNGQIVQQGNHNKLVVDEKGKYFELWNAQAQYYTEKE